MTRVLKLELKGFKSFAKKTEVPFSEDFNCVLGPNGSGKSNILDAMCFVLGKSGAKGLRAEKTANLIYNGGKSKKGAKEGEVSIYFDNSSKIFGVEFDFVKVTRVVRASGQSVYKLNDKAVTRNQILDLLSRAKINPDGYNIILQGDIVRLVEMSSVERRQIVEEIAGISVYEQKKQKALRELQRVEDKMNEAEIILSERKAHLKELKADRDKALKFKELDEKIKRNKLTVIVSELAVKEKKSSEIDKVVDKLSKDISKSEEKIQKLREKIEFCKSSIKDINAEIEEKGEKEQVELQKEIEKLKVDFALNKQRISSIEAEIEKITARRSELSSSFSDVESKLKILNKSKVDFEADIKKKEVEIERIDKKIEDFRKKNKLESASDVDRQIEGVDSKIESLQEAVNKLREEQQSVIREKDKVENKLATIDDKISKLLSVKKEHKEALDNLKGMKTEFKKTASELNQALSEDASLAAQISTAHSKLLSRKEDLAKLEARTAALREQTAGGQAIKEVLDLNLKGVFGVISELGNVSSDNSMALEIAAGGRINSIVVDSDETAAKCINHLKKNRTGVATFIPLNKIKTQGINESIRKIKSHGVVGLAIDLISFEKKYEKAFEFVFGSTLVVEDVSVARRLGVGSVRMVTRSGDLIEVSGAMQGGHRQRSRQAGFVEKETRDSMVKLSSEISDLESVNARLSQKRRDNDELINRLREFKANLEGDIIKIEKSLRLESDDVDADKTVKKELAESLKTLDAEYDRVSSSISQSNSELARAKIEKQKLRDQINQLRNPALLAELTSYEQKKSELKEDILNLKSEIKNSTAQIDSILGPEKENISKIFKQLDREEKDFSSELKSLISLIKTQERELHEKEARQKKFYEKFKSLFNKRNDLTTDMTNHENSILRENEGSRSFEQKINANNIEHARLKAEIAGLSEEKKLYDNVSPYKDKSLDVVRKEIRDFERMMEDFGSVNMRALEIYDSVEIEYKKLNEKKEKLRLEKEDVLVMINEVDSKKKELFMKTYEVVNHNFKEIFNTLSTKGEATLNLENPKDVFEGGLNIKVKLSGTKYMDIRSLSGGEKTLTALAFLFAVQEHDPAAFYILDEVDAALDKKNSERLAKLVKQYSDRAQYIIISHNDSVINEADTLFGISMNEHGESKVTSLRI